MPPFSPTFRAVSLRAALLAAVPLVLIGLVIARAQAEDESPPAPRATTLATAFTYQGRIAQDGVPVTGTCDFRFAVFAAPTGGVQLITSVQQLDVPVNGGLFTTTVDLGSATLQGEDRYLGTSLRCPAGSGDFVELAERQALTPTPYSIRSLSTTNDQVGGGGGSGWSLTGNAGTTAGTNFIGTTDNVALELRVNGVRALRLEPNATSANIIGGFPGNSVTGAVVGVTIGGGANNVASGDFSTIAGGDGNSAAVRAAVGGGFSNAATADSATVGGGYDNTVSAESGTIAGGWLNMVTGDAAFVGGGYGNSASAIDSTVSGGFLNTASGPYATIGGGSNNIASAPDATVSGELANTASVEYSTVGGGHNNTAGGTAATVAGGGSNNAGFYAAVGGGFGNVASGDDATIGGGSNNIGSASEATVSGGHANTASGEYSTVGGGSSNTASGVYSTVGGGRTNTSDGSNATVGGGESNTAGVNATVGGGFSNAANFDSATVGGGYDNTASNDSSTVAGGWVNVASGNQSTVGGGYNNQATKDRSIIAGGTDNLINGAGEDATIGGGSDNTVTADSGTVAGGWLNTVSGEAAFVGGGYGNTASGLDSMVPGGFSNIASGNYSFAAGRRAQADDHGAFLWADSTDAAIASPGVNTFSVRASGGIWLGTTSTPSIGAGNFINTSTGARLTTGGAWTNASDVNLKTNFRAINTKDVLAKLVALPVTTWNYKAESSDVLRMGPMAQDFYAAFGLGDSDKSIGTVDAQGVAFAAIQGLYETVQDENADLRAENAELESRVARLESAAGFAPERGSSVPSLGWLSLLVATVAGSVVVLRKVK